MTTTHSVHHLGIHAAHAVGYWAAYRATGDDRWRQARPTSAQPTPCTVAGRSAAAAIGYRSSRCSPCSGVTEHGEVLVYSTMNLPFITA